MNLQLSVANLICVALTFVQVSLWSELGHSTPNMEPPATNPTTSTITTQEPLTLSEQNSSQMESLTISDPNNNIQKVGKSTDRSSSGFGHPFNATFVSYWGPYEEKRLSPGYFFGVGFQAHHTSTEKLLGGIELSIHPNLVLYSEWETLWNPHFFGIKSFSYILKLEFDAQQGLSSLLTLSQYRAGMGTSTSLGDKLLLFINVYPLSQRGFAYEGGFRHSFTFEFITPAIEVKDL